MPNGTIAAEHLSFYEKGTNNRTGILAWLLSTDHKRIGLMYLFTISSFFIVGAIFGILMRF